MQKRSRDDRHNGSGGAKVDYAACGTDQATAKCGGSSLG